MRERCLHCVCRMGCSATSIPKWQRQGLLVVLVALEMATVVTVGLLLEGVCVSTRVVASSSAAHFERGPLRAA